MSNDTIRHIATVFPINAEALQSETTLPQRRAIVKEFGLNTSTHGIPGIARSQSIPNRLFWFVMFVAFTGIMLYFVIQAVLAYYSYPTQTIVQIADQWPQAFPAVTICNYSPFRYDKFIDGYLNYTNARNLTNTTNTTTFLEEQSLYIADYVQDKLNRNESLDEYYYPLSSMLIKCVYNNARCSASDFINFTSPLYGLCYTFNALAPNIDNGTVRLNNEYGYSGELQLDLYIHSEQYVPFLTDAVSIVVMLHDNTQLSVIEKLGIRLTPGRKHKIGYSKRSRSFLPSPYTTCNNEVTPGMQAMFDQFSGVKYDYSLELCFSVALQTYTYEQCGCVNPNQWASRYVIPWGSTNVVQVPLCNASDSRYFQAADAFQSSSVLSDKYASSCTLECSMNDFITTISSGVTPVYWYIDDIKRFVESSSFPSTPSNDSTVWSTRVAANYVSLDVVCETTRVESYTQQATMSAVDVISNIGGQTGLWIGISFLSLMEFAEMFYRLIRHQCHSIRRRIFKRRQGS